MAIPRKASVLIANSEPVTRFGLVQLINSHAELRVCAEAESAPPLRELCARWRPELIVLDPTLGDGFALIKDLHLWVPQTRVVVFAGSEDPVNVQRALKAGAVGYVTRHDPLAALIYTLASALRGERHIGPHAESLLLGGLACGSMEMRGGETAKLSDREMQIFQMIGAGRSTQAVAAELRLSVKTIHTHRQRIKEKLHVANGTELQRRAVLFHSPNGHQARI